MNLLTILKNHSDKARTTLSAITKLIILISIIYAIYFHLWRILFIDLLLLILIFIPSILKRYEIKIPSDVEFIIFTFVIISFFLGEIRGLIIQIFFGLSIGFVGFLIMIILFSKSKVKANYFIIILFSISLSLALGLSLEITKYYTKIFFNTPFQIIDYQYAMQSLTLVTIGATLASILGLIYMKGHKMDIMNFLVNKFKKQNPNFFIKKTESPEEVLELIKKGENNQLEFKSTLRTNLHTNQFDKDIEFASLKTITAFLNTEGGTLLIGVSDNSEIIGIEKDSFFNNDRFLLHFTNLIKEHIGNQCIPYLTSELITINNKKILKVDCLKSRKPVFLKIGKNENFYIRIGPASVHLTGSRLVDYIRSNF